MFLQLKNIRKSYGDKDYKVEVLNDVSLKQDKNEIVDIVGKSGCGKSALLKLLIRFWKLRNGEIQISNKNIEDINSDDFENYVEFLFKTYGDCVKYWLTINEQDHVVHMPFRLGLTDDNRKEKEKLDFLANHNMCVATAKAIKKCHEIVKDGKIGPATCFEMMYPTTNNPLDNLACMDAMEIRKYYLLDLTIKGEYNGTFKRYLEDRDMMPEIYPGDMKLLKDNTPDLLAFNYYYSESISTNPLTDDSQIGDIEFKLLPSKEAGIYQVVKNENLGATLWGWEIDDVGLQLSARLLWERYNLPLLITENGFGNKEEWPSEGILEDDDRIDYLKRHLHHVKEAMNLGVEFIGFCAWSFMD